MVARDEAFKAETTEKAFENSGIRPFNPNIFTKADYAPSRVSSTQAHTPSTYPWAVFRYQPYTHLPRNDDDLADEDPCDGDNTDGEGDGYGDRDRDRDEDEDGNGNGNSEGYDSEGGMDEDNLDEDDQIIMVNNHSNDEPSHTGSSNHHQQMPQSPLPLPPAPVKLPAIVVGNLHQWRNSEHFKLGPALTQPLQLSQAMAEIQRLTEQV
jgi:hypothetical protein